MNLKEAFRYQNFLNSLFDVAMTKLAFADCALKTTKKHLTSAVISENADYEEIVESACEYTVTNIVALVDWIIVEKEALTKAICEAKNNLDFNVDAAIEANKYRQTAYSTFRNVLTSKVASTRKERGSGYKFNGEGNQVPYYYDVEVTTTERFNREETVKFSTELISEADKVSARIDEAMVNTKVDYQPTFNVNLSFDDVIKSEKFNSTK